MIYCYFFPFFIVQFKVEKMNRSCFYLAFSDGSEEECHMGVFVAYVSYLM